MDNKLTPWLPQFPSFIARSPNPRMLPIIIAIAALKSREYELTLLGAATLLIVQGAIIYWIILLCLGKDHTVNMWIGKPYSGPIEYVNEELNSTKHATTLDDYDLYEYNDDSTSSFAPTQYPWD